MVDLSVFAYFSLLQFSELYLGKYNICMWLPSSSNCTQGEQTTKCICDKWPSWVSNVGCWNFSVPIQIDRYCPLVVDAVTPKIKALARPTLKWPTRLLGSIFTLAKVLSWHSLSLILRFARIIINCIWPLGNLRNHKDSYLANASSVFVEAKDFPTTPPSRPKNNLELSSLLLLRGLFSYLRKQWCLMWSFLVSIVKKFDFFHSHFWLYFPF